MWCNYSQVRKFEVAMSWKVITEEYIMHTHKHTHTHTQCDTNTHKTIEWSTKHTNKKKCTWYIKFRHQKRVFDSILTWINWGCLRRCRSGEERSTESNNLWSNRKMARRKSKREEDQWNGGVQCRDSRTTCVCTLPCRVNNKDGMTNGHCST